MLKYKNSSTYPSSRSPDKPPPAFLQCRLQKPGGYAYASYNGLCTLFPSAKRLAGCAYALCNGLYTLFPSAKSLAGCPYASYNGLCTLSPSAKRPAGCPYVSCNGLCTLSSSAKSPGITCTCISLCPMSTARMQSLMAGSSNSFFLPATLGA